MNELSHESAAPPETLPDSSAPGFALIALEEICPSPTNPRKNFDGLGELAESIRSMGVLQPVLVRPAGDDAFELVCGERRYRAAQMAGLREIPAVVRELSDSEARKVQIVENLQRKDVSALEEATGYAALLEAMAAEQPEATREQLVQTVADEIGKSVRYVWARMKLRELIPALQEWLEAGRITPSHGDLLAALDEQEQEAARKYMAAFLDSWPEETPSVRQLKAWLERRDEPTPARAAFPEDGEEGQKENLARTNKPEAQGETWLERQERISRESLNVARAMAEVVGRDELRDPYDLLAEVLIDMISPEHCAPLAAMLGWDWHGLTGNEDENSALMRLYFQHWAKDRKVFVVALAALHLRDISDQTEEKVLKGYGLDAAKVRAGEMPNVARMKAAQPAKNKAPIKPGAKAKSSAPPPPKAAKKAAAKKTAVGKSPAKPGAAGKKKGGKK
jgi:ParB/RepB/Spo0J family partition protein